MWFSICWLPVQSAVCLWAQYLVSVMSADYGKMWNFWAWLFPLLWLHAGHAVSVLSECKSVCVFTYSFFKISSPWGEAVLQRKVSLWLKWCSGVLVSLRINRLVCRCVTNGTVTLDYRLVGSFGRPFWKRQSLLHDMIEWENIWEIILR